jgi:hypothetical protein
MHAPIHKDMHNRHNKEDARDPPPRGPPHAVVQNESGGLRNFLLTGMGRGGGGGCTTMS